jgi:hypothetical protein
VIISFLFSNFKVIGKLLFTSVVFFILLITYSGFNSTYGFKILVGNANATLNDLQKSLTSSMISIALNQINQSRSTDPEEHSRGMEMAKATIANLTDDLSKSSEGLTLRTEDPQDHELCQQNPKIDCMIGDLRFALDQLYNGSPEAAEQVLRDILTQLT